MYMRMNSPTDFSIVFLGPSLRSCKHANSNWDDDYLSISSEVQTLLTDADTQIPLAKVRMIASQVKAVATYHGFVVNDAK
jgi:hypothetical protein